MFTGCIAGELFNNEYRMVIMSENRKLDHLEIEHFEELLSLESGADIFSPHLAKLCREIEATEPAFIIICSPQGEYDGVGVLPYFGAIATKIGLHFAKRYTEANN